MRICIPTTSDLRAAAIVCDHFGSAPYFTIYETTTQRYEILKNADVEHEHGACRPTHGLADRSVDCVVCRSLGARALHRLSTAGITVLRTDGVTVADVLGQLADGRLREMDPKHACDTHHCR